MTNTTPKKMTGIDVQPILSDWIRQNAEQIAAASGMTYEEVIASADAAENSVERVRMMDIYQRRPWIDPRK